MATAEDLLDDLRDRLDDEGDTKYSEAMKLRFLNRGQAAMFPKIYRTVRDATLAIIDDTFEYAIPAAVGSSTKIIEIEVEDAAGRYFPIERYLILYGLTDPILRLTGSSLPGPVGANIRITAIAPLTPFTSGASSYNGPDSTDELPVLYAMGLAYARRLDDRMDFQRYSTTNQVAGIEAADVMTASQFWFAQFELLLERHALPLPHAAI